MWRTYTRKINLKLITNIMESDGLTSLISELHVTKDVYEFTKKSQFLLGKLQRKDDVVAYFDTVTRIVEELNALDEEKTILNFYRTLLEASKKFKKNTQPAEMLVFFIRFFELLVKRKTFFKLAISFGSSFQNNYGKTNMDAFNYLILTMAKLHQEHAIAYRRAFQLGNFDEVLIAVELIENELKDDERILFRVRFCMELLVREEVGKAQEQLLKFGYSKDYKANHPALNLLIILMVLVTKKESADKYKYVAVKYAKLYEIDSDLKKYVNSIGEIYFGGKFEVKLNMGGILKGFMNN